MIAAGLAYTTYLNRSVIFPKFKVYSYVLSQAEPWSELIAGTYSQVPFDLTPYVQGIEWTLDALRVQLADDAALLFHPDGGTLRATIGPGRAIRLKEGFEGLAESEWLWTFSGTVEGHYAWIYDRGERLDTSFTAYGRGSNQAWKRRNVTSRHYTVGSDWSSMFMNVVKDIMMLENNEVEVPEPWHVLFDKNTNQVVNYPPWDAMEQLLWGIGARPFFNGEGKLDLIPITQDRVSLTLPDNSYLMKYEARASSSETINKVILTYLSNALSRVDGPDQVLGSASITAGFITGSQSEDVYYSDERKTRSDNPRFVVRKSVNATFLPVGSESMTKIDEFHSRIDVDVSVVAQIVLIWLLFAYLAVLATTYFTLGLMTVAQATVQSVILIEILLLMSTLGTGQYEIWGTPYEMVYLEQQTVAVKSGVEFWQEREKEIRNDFISTSAQAQPLVLTQLHYEVMKEQPRTLVLRYDPRLEPGDVIELSSLVRIYIDDIKRGMRRGTSDPLSMTVTGYRTVV